MADILPWWWADSFLVDLTDACVSDFVNKNELNRFYGALMDDDVVY